MLAPVRTPCVTCLMGDKRALVVVALFRQALHGWNVMTFLLLANCVRRNQQWRCTLADRRVSIECKLDWRLVREADEISLGNTVDAHTLANAVAVIVFCVAVEITTVSILARDRGHFHHDVDEESFLGVRPLIHLDEGTIVKCDVKDL